MPDSSVCRLAERGKHKPQVEGRMIKRKKNDDIKINKHTNTQTNN